MDIEKKSEDVAVACRNLTKTYYQGFVPVHALQGVDLDVYVGETMMIVGPSGSGKTTLVSVISTLLQADSGVCEIFGKDIFRFSKEERILYRQRTIGFVFQAFNLLPALTAQENVAIPLLLGGMERKKAMEQAARMVDAVGLGKRLSALPSQMSGGEQQRVAIARALIHRPRLIICDEPTSNLDHRSGVRIVELLKGMTHHFDATLLIVTHDDRIIGYADRIAHMDDGRIVKIESVAESVPR